MAILGITDGQTSGAAVVAGGRLVSAINEERIVRLKMARGFPRRSITEALRLAGVEARDVTGVAVAQNELPGSFGEVIDVRVINLEVVVVDRDGVRVTGLKPEDFRLSRLRYVEPRPYPEEEFQRTYNWMLSWGLVPQDASYEQLVDNRIGAAG